MSYVLWFSVTALVAAGLTPLVIRLARRQQVVDDPQHHPERKQQRALMPLLGGWVIYLVIIGALLWLLPMLTQGYLLPKQLLGILCAAGIIMLGGTIDDIWGLPPQRQIIFPIVATIVIIAVGIGPSYITNPVGGVWRLDQWQLTVLTWQGIPYYFTFLADMFTIGWLLVTMYTTKLLDGLDGLVPGITVIGGLIIFFLSISPKIGQPETGVIALVLAGAAAGFLIWNMAPAKIYLGEGGALLTGFMLGVLAILSGGKIATLLLILGLPMIDLVWVVIRRVWIEHKSPFSGDTLHLHYQLRLLGMSDRSIALVYYIVTLLFGVSTLWFSGVIKLILLIILALASFAMLFLVYHKAKELKH